MGNTAMQEVATVLVAHSGLVPEGSSRSRAASELAEMFARADGETEALPDKGPDAAARSALEFPRRNVSGGCGVSRVGDEGGRKAAR